MVLGIDLGSNTLRAVIMDGNFNILKNNEIIVASAKGLKKDHNLPDDAKYRILKALRNFKKEFNFDIPCRAVATEAFRMAKDSKQFFDEIFKEFNIDFKIINGISEAKFVKLGILNRLNSLGICSDKALFIDLGGASTEIIYEEYCKSFKFGIIRFYNEFPNLEIMMRNCDNHTKNAREFIKKFDFQKVVLTSGVPTTMAALKVGLDYQTYLPKAVNGQKLKYKDFKFIFDYIVRMREDEADFKLGDGRKMPLAAGILLLSSLLKDYKSIDYLVVDDGLREGVCVAHIKNRFEKIIKENE